MLSIESAKQLVNDICAVDGVAGVSRGRFGDVTLRYPGERVGGLKLVGDALQVQIVADFSAQRNLYHVSEDVRQLCLSAFGDEVKSIDVFFADVDEVTASHHRELDARR